MSVFKDKDETERFLDELTEMLLEVMERICNECQEYSLKLRSQVQDKRDGHTIMVHYAVDVNGSQIFIANLFLFAEDVY